MRPQTPRLVRAAGPGATGLLPVCRYALDAPHGSRRQESGLVFVGKCLEMAARRFGGRWTEEKLEALRLYVEAYLEIFTKNPRAKKLTRIYVDAFAGTGYREEVPGSSTDVPLFPELLRGEAAAFREGSTRIGSGSTH